MRQVLLILIMAGTLYAQSIEEQNKMIEENMREMRNSLYKEFKTQRKYIQKEYTNSSTKYFELIEYENFPSLDFSFPISKREALHSQGYIKVIYSNHIPVEIEEYDRDNQQYNGISYLDRYVRVIETYYSTYDYTMTNYYNNSSDAISCKNKGNQKSCIIYRTLSQDIDISNSSDSLVPSDDKNIYQILKKGEYHITGEEYLKRIKIKRGREYFSTLLEKEKNLSSALIKYFKDYHFNDSFLQFIQPNFTEKTTYIKVFYKHQKPFKAHWYNENKLTKSVELNEQGQITKITDFKFLTIKEYKYHDKRIDEIECLYLKGTCSVREVEQVKM